MVRIKICGITNLNDALVAVEYGADALGFVFYPKSPRFVTSDTAKSIISALPPFVMSVGVFVDTNREEIERISSQVGLDVIQLHGSEPPEMCNLNKKVIKAIKVKERADFKLLDSYKNKVSAFLLDSYSPHLLGGTGEVFNWDIAVEAKRFGRIILAGGLTPDNIEEAIRKVRPYGVDVSSGVEGDRKGRKEHKKLRLFIERARRA